MSLDSATEYALSFSEDAVHLERRDRVDPGRRNGAPAAWRHLGSVDFASPAFREEIARLRAMATGGEGTALPVTLIIPDDQILYTTLTVAPEGDRERAVGRALDGLTPYAIEELSFDWAGEGDSVRVAAVARQTLREACDFAEQYGFEGQGYCAAPAAGLYPGEPVFVLETAPRVRPQVDLAQAAVTSSALMIEEEAPEELRASADAGQEDADRQDAGGQDGTPGAGPGPGAAAGQADLPGPEQVSAKYAADEDTGEDAEETPEGDAPEDAPDSGFGPAAPDMAEPVPGTDAGAEEDEEAAPAMQALPGGDAAGLAAVGLAAAAGQAPAGDAGAVPRPSPVAAGGASAPGAADPAAAARGSGPAQAPAGLNARARALHERAAGARKTRPAGSAPAQSPRRPGERGGLAGLVAMLGALVVGLILIWAFLVPDGRDAQMAAVAPVEQPRPQPAGSGVAQAPQMPAASPDGISSGSTSPVSPPSASASGSSPLPAQDGQARPVAAAARPADSAVAPVSALTEEERRRVIVAAAAVAAAVVPPPAATSAAASTAVPSVSPSAAAPSAGAPSAGASTAQPASTVPARPASGLAQPATAALAAGGTGAAPADPGQGAAPAAPALDATRLTSSARPQLAPRRSTPQTSVPRADAAPRLPSDPLPFEASQRQTRPATSARPPSRNRPATAPAISAAPAAAATTSAVPAAAPAAIPVSGQAATGNVVLRGSARPPARPEGSAPELAMPEALGSGASADGLTPEERQHLRELVRDLGRHGLAARDPLPQGPRLAQARPQPRPQPGSLAAGSDAPAPSAIDAALRSAAMPPPDRPDRDKAAAAPARDSGGLLLGTARPRARPAASGAAAAVSGDAVEAAISAAVAASPAPPGGVRLSALASSPLPPRRSQAASGNADPAAPPREPAAAAAPGPSEADLAARRALDEQLQAQAEARIRARAAADAKAEAEARAAAEARARAQAEAEERAARARSQDYKPPELDNEPEIAAGAASGGATAASVAKAATQARGLDLGRTTIIGIIGAGKASRALIRLRSGKIVTVRLGDRIDGGTINSIGDGRLTYVKAGRTHELRMLDGR